MRVKQWWRLKYSQTWVIRIWVVRNPGLYDFFCPVPAKSPLIPYIKSLSYTNMSYAKPGLYDRFSRSPPKIYLVYTNSRYGLRGKIAHFSTFFSVLLQQQCRFFSYFVNLSFYVNCVPFYGPVQGHNTVKSPCRHQGTMERERETSWLGSKHV